MSSILSLSEDMYGKKSIVTILYSTSKKWIEAKAESFHNEIEDINDALMEGKFTVHTVSVSYTHLTLPTTPYV